MPLPVLAHAERGPGTRRPIVVAVLVGLGVAVAAGAVAASLFTIPVFGLARVTEPARAAGRTWFATGLRIALWMGLVTGVGMGAAAGWWYARGATWPWSDDAEEDL